jgi:hypothetical protein
LLCGRLIKQLKQHEHHKDLRHVRKLESRGGTSFTRPGTIDDMNAAIIVLLVLLATGVVVSPLLRMRAWLKNTPPAQELRPPLDEEIE